MPLRTCVGCGTIKEKTLLLRFTAVDGVLKPDFKGVLGRRGAYLCPRRACLEAAYRIKGSFSRTLKDKINLPGIDEIWKEIEPSLKERDVDD